MKKRILSVILALLMIIPALAACSENKAEPENAPAADPNTPSVEEVTPDNDELSALEQRQLIPDNLPDVKYDGRDYLVETENRKVYEILSEELTGEACNPFVCGNDGAA